MYTETVPLEMVSVMDSLIVPGQFNQPGSGVADF
jgi:hypothetical protein